MAGFVTPLAKPICAVLALSFLSTSIDAAELTNREKLIASLSPENIAYRVSVTGTDKLDPTLWVSTKPVLEMPGADKFLRAAVDKASGKVIYQIYFQITSFENRANFSRMTYLVDDQLRSLEVQKIGSDVSCQRLGCSFYEDYVAVVPRTDLEAVSKGRSPDDTSWTFRLFGALTQGNDTQMFRVEVAGFLLAVDQQLQSVTH